MSRGLSVEIDATSVIALANSFEATPAQVDAALKSTYAKMGRWCRTRGIRGLSAKLRIKQKILRARVKSFGMGGAISTRGDGAKVWFGLNPISLMRLNAKPEAKGVRADGGRFVEGAFIATVHGRQQVLKRVGKSRLPIVTVYADIEDEARVYVEDEIFGTAAFDAQFFKFLEHELKWRMKMMK